MMFGADISICHLFINALLPATLGNIVGGGFFVGAVYWYVFDSMTSSIQVFAQLRRALGKHTVFHKDRLNHLVVSQNGLNENGNNVIIEHDEVEIKDD